MVLLDQTPYAVCEAIGGRLSLLVLIGGRLSLLLLCPATPLSRMHQQVPCRLSLRRQWRPPAGCPQRCHASRGWGPRLTALRRVPLPQFGPEEGGLSAEEFHSGAAAYAAELHVVAEEMPKVRAAMRCARPAG